MATPRCPYCNTQGLKHLSAHNAGYYAVIYCNQCGAIYGVVPAPQQTPSQEKHILQPAPPVKATPKTKAPNQPDLIAPDIARAIADFTGQNMTLSSEQIEQLYNDAIASQTPAAPKCPEHHLPMVKIVIPIGFKHAGQEIWICSHYTQCRQWQIDDDETLIQKSLSFIAEIGNGDLSKKMPYSPQRMAAMAKIAGIGRGTFYRRIAIPDGPPHCPDHKIEMQRLTIPQGYKNKGVKVWVCPQFDCKKWELVDQK